MFLFLENKDELPNSGNLVSNESGTTQRYKYTLHIILKEQNIDFIINL